MIARGVCALPFARAKRKNTRRRTAKKTASATSIWPIFGIASVMMSPIALPRTAVEGIGADTRSSSSRADGGATSRCVGRAGCALCYRSTLAEPVPE